MKNRFLITISATTASIFALALAAHSAVTVNVIANAGAGQYHVSDGSTLAAGDLLRFGTFDLVAYNALSPAQKNTFSEVDSIFEELGIANSNASGEILSIGIGVVGTPGDQLYTWVFNNSVATNATEWGIFSSNNTLWEVAGDPGSSSLSNSTINQVIHGSDPGDVGGDVRLAAVPEPSMALLSLLGFAALLRRRR